MLKINQLKKNDKIHVVLSLTCSQYYHPLLFEFEALFIELFGDGIKIKAPIKDSSTDWYLTENDVTSMSLVDTNEEIKFV